MCSRESVVKKTVIETEVIDNFIQAGEYSAAAQAIKLSLDRQNLSPTERDHYLFEIERMNRIRKDFTATYDDVLEFIHTYYPQVNDSNMQAWEAVKSLEVKIIDGQKLYFEHAGRNLFRIDTAMKSVWAQQHPDAEISSGSGAKLDLDKHNAQIIQKALVDPGMFVEPKHLRIKQSIEVKANEVPAGEMIKCWIPYPRLISGRQEDIKLILSEPAMHTLAPEDALQRTIYFEKPAIANQAILFSVEYELTTHGVYQDIDPDIIKEVQSVASIEEYLQEEAPHIVFTPALRKLSDSIIGNEQNPYRKAQLLFAWIDEHIPWASAREYSTIQCIPEYAFENGHGDCGIQTLLFMTLCRMNGIPTRWQSGWELQPPKDSMHDWGMIYFEPYGWVPMDITYGLRKSDDPKLRWFYLSGMDSYRIIFNDAYGQSFTPAKDHFRSETVDSQRGEVEWSGGNLYFDQWKWNFDWEILE